jgi:hypothetical protein
MFKLFSGDFAIITGSGLYSKNINYFGAGMKDVEI